MNVSYSRKVLELLNLSASLHGRWRQVLMVRDQASYRSCCSRACIFNFISGLRFLVWYVPSWCRVEAAFPIFHTMEVLRICQFLSAEEDIVFQQLVLSFEKCCLHVLVPPPLFTEMAERSELSHK